MNCSKCNFDLCYSCYRTIKDPVKDNKQNEIIFTIEESDEVWEKGSEKINWKERDILFKRVQEISDFLKAISKLDLNTLEDLGSEVSELLISHILLALDQNSSLEKLPFFYTTFLNPYKRISTTLVDNKNLSESLHSLSPEIVSVLS